jgi:hypothetical protein
MPELTPEAERELAALDDALAGRPVAPDLTELGELARLLRDERPAMPEPFARALERERRDVLGGRPVAQQRGHVGVHVVARGTVERVEVQRRPCGGAAPGGGRTVG